MKTVKQLKQDLDPDLFVRMVQNYPSRSRGVVIPFPAAKKPGSKDAKREDAPLVYSVFFTAFGLFCMVVSLMV